MFTSGSDATRSGSMSANEDYLFNDEDTDLSVKYIDHARSLLSTPAQWAGIAADAAVRLALQELTTPENFEECRRSVTRLLNCISAAYFKHADSSPPSEAIAFIAPKATTLGGDYLGVGEAPDWVSRTCTSGFLRAALDTGSSPLVSDAEDWSKLLSTAEGSTRIDGKSNFLWYLDALKRYRPDLATVHGFRFLEEGVMLASLNACDSWQSGFIHFRVVDLWIAHVVLVYKTLAERDSQLTYCGPTPDGSRWEVNDETRNICVSPFHFSSAPGKMTWAAFETCRHHDGSGILKEHRDETIGFFKTSWQPKGSAVREGELLDKAHKDTWLPGLVRHWSYYREKDPALDLASGDPANVTVRVKEILHLASIGQPLSQCTSALHLFKVFYDLIETHRQMVKRGLLHGDLSWYNVLCNPKHDPAVIARSPDKKIASVHQIPCIEYIITGDTTSEPCALITDLDHGLNFDCQNPSDEAPNELWGTPMFVSTEVSNLWPRSLKPDKLALDALLDKMRTIEDDIDIFYRAFPDDDEEFIKRFRDVLQQERERQPDAEPLTQVHPARRPRHDMESLFWILLWALARARPPDSEVMDCHGSFTGKFVDNMLRHRMGDESYRSLCIDGEVDFTSILHPALARFAPLLEGMVTYLNVPWHEYEGSMIAYDHAHSALQRLLLLEIHSITEDSARLDIKFDTLQPRIRWNHWYDNTLQLNDPDSASLWAKFSHSGSTTVVGTPVSLSSAGRESDQTIPGVDGSKQAAKSKRKRSTNDDDDSESQAQDESETLTNGRHLKRLKRIEETTSPEPAPSYHTATMRKMFLNDMYLWFDDGLHDVAPIGLAHDSKHQWQRGMTL